MFVVDGTPRSPAYVAAQIHQVWVVDAAKSYVESLFDGKTRFLPPSMRDLFTSNIRPYCEATVLRILLTEQQNNPRFDGLVAEFEKLIFLSCPTFDRMTKLEAVKSTMIDLDRLMFEKKELSWAQSWFAGLGHEETNPATLALLVQLLAIDTKSLRELTREIGSSAA